MKGIFVKVEEQAWKDEVKDYLTSLAFKLNRPVYDVQAFPLTGKVIWAVVASGLIGFVIGLAL